MIKRNLAILCIALIIAGIGVTEQVYLRKTLASMEQQTLALQAAIDVAQDNFATEENIKAVKKLSAYWEHHRDGYEIFLSHVYTMELENKVAVLDTHLYQNDYLMTSTDLEGILASLDMIRDLITPVPHMIL